MDSRESGFSCTGQLVITGINCTNHNFYAIYFLHIYIFENNGPLKDLSIQLPGACSDPSIPPHDPHHRRRLVHPGRPPLALGHRGHSGRLYQARPLWRQHNNPQHLRRVSLLTLLLHSIPTWSQTIRVSSLELASLLHCNSFQLGVGALCLHPWWPLLLCLHRRWHRQCHQDALEALAVKSLVTCFEH